MNGRCVPLPLRSGRPGVFALALLLTVLTLAPTAAQASGRARATATTVASGAAASHSIGYDHYSVTIDGKRVYLWSGEFHYWRLPSPDLWRDVLQKMKAAGFNATSIYFDWAYHSPSPGVYDFTGVRDVEKLLKIAEDVGIYVIARPGPYINAETDSGGFPGWVSTQKGRARSSDPDFQAASDEWLHHIDPIIARHQYTDGGGTVILYQVENEYGVNTDAAYMEHTEQVVKADGITVPLTHNHCCGDSTWATGTGAVDLPGQDSYPQGFNCSTPTVWNGVSTLPRFRDDSPIITPEFQGGSFDPWGGPGYAACRQLTGPDFEKVFYKNNVADGATMQNLYMTYGGTSWGWLPDPNQVYTSYDYGAPISEERGLGAKYDEVHRLGYFFNSVAPLTKTDAAASTPPDNAAVLEQARVNPDDGTQFLTLRHADSTSTATDTTHIAVDLSARASFTYDDPDGAASYTGAWSHVGADQTFTSEDYQRTESFSETTGDSVSVTFTGTAVRWISSYDTNHGIADVYLDGAKVATVDGYGSAKATQQVFFARDGLTSGEHTLKIVVTGTQNAKASGHFVVVDAIDVPPPGTVRYPTVPQQPGTALTLAGRDAKVLVANYALGQARLVYSTSEILTHAAVGGRDVAVLYGRSGESGETVLRYDSPPTVTTADGDVSTTWDADRHDLRLNYRHAGQVRVFVDGVTGGVRHLLELFLTTDEGAARWWRVDGADTAAEPVLVYGPQLLRTAAVSQGVLAATGDTDAATTLRVIAPTGVAEVTWNGAPVSTRLSADGTLDGSLAGPAAVSLPALTGWRYSAETPEASPGFDDSSWTVADHLTTNNPAGPGTLPVLYVDDYGFHHGDVWYRGRFTATGKETAVSLAATTGRAGVYAAWLNGVYLGSSGSGTTRFAIPAGTLRAGGEAVLSVLVENMGHNEDFNADDTHKEPRGLTAASLVGANPALTWRIQGNTGGEDIPDTVRGPMNAGGLYGERQGWALPGFPDDTWSPVTLPDSQVTPGIGWYRTQVALHLPPGQDTSVGLRITDDAARHYRAQIFVNGWLVGRYINDVGPQHTFAVPNGILRTDGDNTIAIASWGTDASGGLGKVELVPFSSVAGGVPVSDVDSPRYDPRDFPLAPVTARLALGAPDELGSGERAEVSAAFTVPASTPADAGPAREVRVALTVPAGWSATATSPTTFASVAPGGTVTATFTVTAPDGELPAYTFVTGRATFVQRGLATSVGTVRAVRGRPKPPSGSPFVSDLPFQTATNGWGPVERDRSNGENAAADGTTMGIRGGAFAKGLGVHATSGVTVYLGGQCSRLTAVVGVDDEVVSTVAQRGQGGTAAFQVLADGVAVYTSPTLTSTSDPVAVSADLTGADQVELAVTDGGDSNELDHADWGDAQLTCAN